MKHLNNRWNDAKWQNWKHLKHRLARSWYCELKVWAYHVHIKPIALHVPLTVSEPRRGRKTEGVCTCRSGCLWALECSWGTWLMLRTRLRDSVSVGLLSPPDTCWYTRLYPIFSSISFLQLLSFEADTFFWLNCNAIVPAQCNLSFICWIIAAVLMIPVSPETTLHANRRHSGTLSIVLSILLHEMDKFIGYWLIPVPVSTSIHPHHCPFLPPGRLGLVSVWQALGPVRWPVGCDGQQLRVPLPAVWRPLGSRPGTQPAKVTSLQLSSRKKKKKKKNPYSYILWVIPVPHCQT